MNYDYNYPECSHINPESVIRKGDLVRKEYTGGGRPGRFRATASEYIANRGGDLLNFHSGTYTVLKKYDPLAGLGLGAVIRFVSPISNTNVFIKTGTDTFVSKRSGKAYPPEHFAGDSIEILSEGLKD